MRVEVTIKRENGTIETTDVTEKLNGFINQPMFDKLKSNTKKAGRGELMEAKLISWTSNIKQLIKNYNNVNNEGGEGYVPDTSYFTKMDTYKKCEKVVVFK